MPFGAVQLVATMGGAWLATYWKKKGPVLALLCLPPIAGCVMLLHITHDAAHRGPLLAGYYLVSDLWLRSMHSSLAFANHWLLQNRSLSTLVLVSYQVPLEIILISNYPSAPLVYSWSAANTAGETKKKVTTGILIVGQCVGNVCSAPQPNNQAFGRLIVLF